MIVSKSPLKQGVIYMVHPALVPVASLIAGVIILIFPKVLNYIVALYLILVGIIGLVHFFNIPAA